jgi:hypothetical protein
LEIGRGGHPTSSTGKFLRKEMNATVEIRGELTARKRDLKCIVNGSGCRIKHIWVSVQKLPFIAL